MHTDCGSLLGQHCSELLVLCKEQQIQVSSAVTGSGCLQALVLDVSMQTDSGSLLGQHCLFAAEHGCFF